MLLRRISVENVRSFLDRQDLVIDGNIAIIIGPNGGGKTNLLDSIIIMLRRYLFGAGHIKENITHEGRLWQYNDRHDEIERFRFERHSAGIDRPQNIEIEIEVTSHDIESMETMKYDPALSFIDNDIILSGNPWNGIQDWDLSQITSGQRMTYKWQNGSIIEPDTPALRWFLKFMQTYEIDNFVRFQAKKTPLRMPMLYLPVNRSSHGFHPQVTIHGFDYFDQKRGADFSYSRLNANYVQLSIGQLASIYRILQEDPEKNAKSEFLRDPRVVKLTDDLSQLGYSWKLETVNPLMNSYNIKISKKESSFSVADASSGERELLTYLFTIHALNVRDALILIDEPELHLHPRWQSLLMSMFEILSKETGNQFIMATHSPKFISPDSINYVSRIYRDNNTSKIVRLDESKLPKSKHLFNTINSHNNECIFFADVVLLVEGISDRIFFQKLLDYKLRKYPSTTDKNIEIVSVGGKSMFPSYKKLLTACGVESVIVADLDYVNQIGTKEIKKLLEARPEKIKELLTNDPTSTDAKSFVELIDQAIDNKDWSKAEKTWQYIKLRHQRMKTNLSEHDRTILDNFIEKQRELGIFVLRYGELEDYLPQGFRSKDVDKLIEFINQPDFWDQLPLDARNEIEQIADDLLKRVGVHAA